MRRFVYAPDVSIYIATKNHGILDVSLDTTEGSVHRVLDAASTATFVLQNPRNKYIADRNGDPIFRPMDRVVIFLTRIYKPMQVFAGYLDDVPYEQFIPGVVTLNATCTLKRLLYTYFDPSLPYTMQRLAKFGWQYDPTDGSLRDSSENFFDQDTGGGLGDLMRFMLHEVGGWNIADSNEKLNTVHIMPLPKSFIKKVASVMVKDMEEAQTNIENVEKVLEAFMNRGGNEATGVGGESGGTNTDDNPVPPKFEGIYKASIYGNSFISGDTGIAGPKAAKVVSEAKSQLGVPYVYGAETENKAFDCSGLTQWAYQQIGINIPHNAAAQFNDSKGKSVNKSDLQPADLVFFEPGIGHVGIYIGGGNFIHAPHTGDVVKISPLSNTWYTQQYQGARRYIHETDEVPVGGSTKCDYVKAIANAFTAKGMPAVLGVATAILESGIRPDAANSGGYLGIFQNGIRDGRAPVPPAAASLWQTNFHGGNTLPGLENVYPASLQITQAAEWFARYKPSGVGSNPTPAQLQEWAIAAQGVGPSIQNGYNTLFLSWATEYYKQGLQTLATCGATPEGGAPAISDPDLTGNIGDVRVPTGFPITSTFHISPNPFGNDQLVFRAVKTNPKLAQNQIQIYVPGAIDDSTDQAKQWHQQGITNVTIDSSENNGDGKPFGTENQTTTQASATALDITTDIKTYDPLQVIGESQDQFIDLYNIAQAEVIGNSIIFPTAGDVAEAELLSGQRALYNDIPLMKWVETASTASGRRFQSMPNGDFLAFYPDYFGWAETELYSTPYFRIADIEIISGDITLSDRELTTHYFTTGDIDRSGDISIYDRMKTMVASVENSGAFKSFTNSDDFDFTAFLQRYGPRPFVDEQVNIKHPGVQYLYAWQHFLLKWARQFPSKLETTFLPEIYPGGLIEISSKGIVMFVESVTHSWNRESGFTTSIDLIAPSTTTGKNAGMVLAG